MTESIICPLWDNNNRRFQTRRYHAWDCRCGSCGRKVVISEAVKRKIDAGGTVPVIREQCALTFPNEPKNQIPRWHGKKGCELCSVLEKQLEQARLEMYALENSPDRKTAERTYRKWAHLSDMLAHHDHREADHKT